MGLGFGARGGMVRLENGVRDRDDDSLRFYVAITLPQIPLSEINGVVNLLFTWPTNMCCSACSAF